MHAGEIVGIAGVEGNGQTELIEAIIGLHAAVGRRSSSTASTSTNDVDAASGAAAGIGYIPEDRQHDGLVLPSPLWENAMLGHQRQAPFAKGLWIDRKAAPATHRGDHRPSSTCARRAPRSRRSRSRAATSRS